MDIRVEDFIELCIDQDSLEVKLYSLSVGDCIWSGFLDDMPEFLAKKLVMSYDLPEQSCITINID